MSDPGFGRDKGINKAEETFADDANLGTPITLDQLYYPVISPWLDPLPSDLTPPSSAVESLTSSPPPNLVVVPRAKRVVPELRSKPMDPFDRPFERPIVYGDPDPANPVHTVAPSADASHADWPTKPRDETPRKSRTNKKDRFNGAIEASFALYQQLDLVPPEPNWTPPHVPHDLEQRFIASLDEYGVDRKLHGHNPLDFIKTGAGMQKALFGNKLGKAVLEKIREETDSPLRSAYNEAGPSGAPPGFSMKPPTCLSLNQPPASMSDASVGDLGMDIHRSAYNRFEQQKNFDPANRASTDRYSNRTNGTYFKAQGPDGMPHDAYLGFDSSTTFVGSRSSYAGSSAAPRATAHQQAIGFPEQNASSARDHYGTHHRSDLRFQAPQSSSALLALEQRSTDPGHPQQLNIVFNRAYNGGLDFNDVRRHIHHAPSGLFPSAQVGQQASWDFVQKADRSIAPHGFIPDGYAPAAAAVHTNRPFPMSFITDPQTAVPHDFASREYAPAAPINTKMPAPMRYEPQTAAPIPNIAIQPPSPKIPTSKKRSAGISYMSGPTKTKPRAANDTAGLPILSADKEAKREVNLQSYEPTLLAILLPWSSAMERLYALVRDPHLFTINEALANRVDPPIVRNLVSIAFYDTSVTPHKEIRYIGPGDVASITYREVNVFVDPRRAIREAEGEGRWVYVVVEGHASPESDTRPHVAIAWQKSAVTRASDSLHTVYPDNHIASKAAAPTLQKVPKGHSSLQDMAGRYAASHTHMRTASSAEVLGDNVAARASDGALTFKKEVWKMEMAGKIPLIAGQRVKLAKWKGWLDAVGAGKGKVVVWRERE
ncbi:hypothetical protein CC86DRAFT_452909 [Ophiobolus disseminans]|uniref:Uncharacterized protein n=1 Tax=Ophiobolus disseminans TaxID=1469910 RepID=A0A6A7ACP8_9PLEO|nr:hypothetical protein CC86DRAFT_452909 [Ophiobolus disseminans]